MEEFWTHFQGVVIRLQLLAFLSCGGAQGGLERRVGLTASPASEGLGIMVER